MAVALALCAGVAAANPFASSVVSYDPGPGQFVGNPMYNDPSKCLGAPKGLAVSIPDNSSIVTLGDGGSVTLAFAGPVHDNPRNPYGLDFIVFSNAQFVGGNPGFRWQELAFVEISQNGADWYLILPSILPSQLRGGIDTGNSYTPVCGYAEYTPTMGLPQVVNPGAGISRTAEELYTVPDRPSIPGDESSIAFDYVSGGGDAMDIAWAVAQVSPGVPAFDGSGNPIPANIGWFRYIRITDALVGDKLSNEGEISAEIDAVSEVRQAMTIGEARSLAEGGYALITEAVVTTAFEGEFFVQAPDRSAALKLRSRWPVQPGDMVTATGHLSRLGGRFILPDAMFTATSSENPLPAPLGMPLRSLGADLAYGLRVRTWGEVTDEGDGSYCVITDGASSAKVVCDQFFYVPAGSYLAVTGVCDREEGSEQAIVRVSDPYADVTTHGR